MLESIEFALLRDYSNYPPQVVADILRIREQIMASGLPPKVTDRNLLIGTWNIKSFSRVYRSWDENPHSPKRNWRAMSYLVEVIRRLDVVAIQEVRRNLSAIRLLVDWLGPDWGMIVTDVNAGSPGNLERLGFVFDRRRVKPSGLAGEIVLPPTQEGNPIQQFARAPYAVGFTAGEEHFVLVTTHIKYGRDLQGRRKEISAFANYISSEMKNRIQSAYIAEKNLIILGDFNIEKRGDDPLFQAFISTGLLVPHQLDHLRTTFGSEPKYYDQIAWFKDELDLPYNDQAGVIDYAGAVFPELTLREMSYRVSDHLPLWVEFRLDRSNEKMTHNP